MNKAILASTLLVISLFSGCCNEPRVSGISDFKVDTSNGAITASVELTFFRTDTMISVQVPQLPNSFLELGPAPDGKGTTLEFYTPFSAIAQAVGGMLPPKGLPDGRPLVGTNSATLPAFDVTIGSVSLRFYVSGDTFGVFLPLPLPQFSGTLQVPLKDPRGYTVAYGNAVSPGSNSSGGGLLVLFPIVTNAKTVAFHNFSPFSS